MPQVQVASTDDFEAWLHLAAEVEPLFGPLVHEATFRAALSKNIARGSAFCIREEDGPPGIPLLGGLLFSAKPPHYRIGWLAIVARARRQGLGAQLLHDALAQVTPPATVSVVTFGPDHPAATPARNFYLRLGFVPGEMTAPGPEGGSRQLFHLQVGDHNKSS